MIDFDLQLKFWRCATDAALSWGQASVAAAEAWQADFASGQPGARSANFQSSMTPAYPNAFFDWMSLWTRWWQPQISAPPAWPNAPNFFAPSQPGWNAWQTGPAFGASATAPTWPQMVELFFTLPAIPWAMYQMPFAAMMMSAGVPASVAFPSARASTSALDAADAARQQFIHAFSAYRTDGGHGFTHSSYTRH